LAAYCSPKPYLIPPHIELLNNRLKQAAVKPDQRIIVSMPPRHGKSELTSHYFPAWYLGRHPGHEIILVSYEERFAASWGAKARDVMREFGPELFDQHLDSTQDARDHWRVGKPQPRNEYGHQLMLHSTMYSAGSNGPITGKGADLLLVDDPIKNYQEIKSDTARDTMWEWWQSTAYTRLMTHGSAVIVQTRWHMDDLAGRLIQQSEDGEEHWDVINIPAIAEENDPLGREVGEALWPEKYPIEALLQKKQSVGAYFWSAMYQGRPTPMEGGILKRDWMNRRYKEPPRMIRIIQSVDAAFKTGVANDFSCIATWGTDGIDYYLLDLFREKVEFPELKQAISDYFYKWNASAVYIEDAAAGQSIIQEMGRQSMVPVVAKAVMGDDFQRAHAISGIFQSGKVILPRFAPWLADWVEEHVAFPNAAHDDTVTTTYYALEELAYLGVPIMEFV